MGKFDGKVLLELGTNVGSVDIVKYAKSEGAYVIVADYLPTDKSEAKQYADETSMVSTRDVEAVYALAKEKQIDGIFCGVSEPNLLTCKVVSERMNLPFYFTMEQWNLVQNKKRFKDLCVEYGVSVPKEYIIHDINNVTELEQVVFPVIVKPVDLGAAIGIHICNNIEQLKIAYNDAKSKSISGNVVVEQYIIGQEVSCYYTFINGECKPSIIIDKYLCEEKTAFTPLPEAYVFPSKWQSVFLDTINEQVMKMFLSIGFHNGVACVQCIANDTGIYVFECGLRIGGNALYRFVEHINGNNFMKMLVDYSLTGIITNDISKEDCNLHGKHGCILSMLNRGGMVKTIDGYEEAKAMESIIDSELRYFPGDEITKNGTLKQSHIRFFIVEDSAENLAITIDRIQNSVFVKDYDGSNMIYSNFDTHKLLL